MSLWHFLQLPVTPVEIVQGHHPFLESSRLIDCPFSISFSGCISASECRGLVLEPLMLPVTSCANDLMDSLNFVTWHTMCMWITLASSLSCRLIRATTYLWRSNEHLRLNTCQAECLIFPMPAPCYLFISVPKNSILSFAQAPIPDSSLNLLFFSHHI